MASADNGEIQYEAGRVSHGTEQLVDSSDHKRFTHASALLFSMYEGQQVKVYANGILTGGTVSVAESGNNNLVDVTAASVYLNGPKTAVAADTDVTVQRGASTDTHRINSITVNSSGSIAVIAGTASTAFSENRGAAGGPPWIPTTSIEIAQVRFTSVTDAPVQASEIFVVPNKHREMALTPVAEISPLGDSDNADDPITQGHIKFPSALAAIHSDDSGSTTATKAVYAEVYEPEFAEVPDGVDFVLPETTHSFSSQQVYKRAIGSSSSSLGQGSFTFYPANLLTDNLVQQKDKTLTFRFYPDSSDTPHAICQGKFGIARSFPVGNPSSVAATISSEQAAVERL